MNLSFDAHCKETVVKVKGRVFHSSEVSRNNLTSDGMTYRDKKKKKTMDDLVQITDHLLLISLGIAIYYANTLKMMNGKYCADGPYFIFFLYK